MPAARASRADPRRADAPHEQARGKTYRRFPSRARNRNRISRESVRRGVNLERTRGRNAPGGGLSYSSNFHLKKRALIAVSSSRLCNPSGYGEGSRADDQSTDHLAAASLVVPHDATPCNVVQRPATRIAIVRFQPNGAWRRTARPWNKIDRQKTNPIEPSAKPRFHPRQPRFRRFRPLRGLQNEPIVLRDVISTTARGAG